MEFIIDQLLDEMKSLEKEFDFYKNKEELNKILSKKPPEKLHRKIGELCFECLENPKVSSEVKKLAKELLFELIKKYPLIAKDKEHFT